MSLEPFRSSRKVLEAPRGPELFEPRYRPVLGPPKEAFAEDLEIRPSSSGQGALMAHLVFRGSDYSGQDFSNSGVVLTLRTQVDPRELPLLSGMMGRSFWIQKLEPLQDYDLQDLRSKYQQLWEQYQFLLESLKELIQEP